jgi:SH2 domain
MMEKAEKLAELASLPHHDEKTWLVSCNRDEAEQLLRYRPAGTFLIRPSSTPHFFALSIVLVSTF